MQIAFASVGEDPDIARRLRTVQTGLSHGGLTVVSIAAPPLGDDTTIAPPAALVLAAPREALHGCCEHVRTWVARTPQSPVIVFLSELDGPSIEALVASGAQDVASLYACDEEWWLRIQRLVGHWPDLRTPAPASSQEAAFRHRLIGNSPVFLRTVAQLARMARCDSGVLLLGETGTGKEVCAQAIHYHSTRSRGPWVAVNCAAIPAELVEDELYGHVKGAYTHASQNRSGLVQEAEGGTLLLDEIDALPLAAQAKLLRFLQEKEFRPVGSSRPHRANVRIVAASNRDLVQAMHQGRFREDLFFRLNVLELRLPPLRERGQDVDLLAQRFFEEFRREASQPLAGLSASALHKLRQHTWPGNVRELRNVVQRAVLLAQGSLVQAHDIALGGLAQDLPVPVHDDLSEDSFRAAKARVVQDFERRYLEQLLQRCDGNISQAARMASKNRRAFFELLRRHDIKAESFRESVR